MNTKELIDLARECGGFSHEYRQTAICFYHEDLQRFAKRIAQPLKQRIAELEKDCEILQTNLDAAIKASRVSLSNAQEKVVPYAWYVPPMVRMYFGEFAQIDATDEARRVGGTAKAVPVGKDWDNFATGFEAGWKECLDHCKPVYMYRRKGTFMPGQYVTCESKAQYYELLELKQFETDILYDVPASDYTIYVDKLKPLYVDKLKPLYTAPPGFDDETRQRALDFVRWIASLKTGGLIEARANDLLRLLETGNGQ